MKKNIQKDGNCIDIGCHKGEILNLMLKYAPAGKHFGFEPIPYMYKELKNKFNHKATILPYALSDNSGTTSFQLVKNAPAYSGIKQRKYDIENPEIEEIEVEVKQLDELITDKIDFIKIDVEGGEFGVLKGAEQVLKENKPVILFECGKGASDYYGTHPADIYNYLTKTIRLNIYTLKSFLNSRTKLDHQGFEQHFNLNTEYYFVAAK